MGSCNEAFLMGSTRGHIAARHAVAQQPLAAAAFATIASGALFGMQSAVLDSCLFGHNCQGQLTVPIVLHSTLFLELARELMGHQVGRGQRV